MARNNQNRNQGSKKQSSDENRKNVSVNDLDKIEQEAEQIRTRKPGSQSNSSKQGNNGRGGGKS